MRTEGDQLTLQCNKTLAGKAMTADDIRNLKQCISRWVGPKSDGTEFSTNHIRIITDDREIGELAVVRRELRRVSPEEQPLRGKTIVLWASHGRYYNAVEDRWVWQRARLWGTVEDRLTTEYTTRLRRMLEASGARVLEPRYTPNDSVGRTIGPSGLPRWMEGATYSLHNRGYGEKIFLAKGAGADYKNDMVSRPIWVNSLLEQGEHIDLVLALHTDGFDEPGDSTSVGTLAIYYEKNDEGLTTLRDGRNRSRTNRQMAYAIHHRLVEAMRREVWDAWGERQIQNANYAEARIPNAPAVLLEIGSHKDIDDARYLLDPHAMDVAATAIYEGVCDAVGADSYAVFPTPTKDSIQTTIVHLPSSDIHIINAFTHTCGPDWFRDSLYAGIIPGHYGIADSVNYALIGVQHNFDRKSPWVSDDDCGWGMCDTRYQRFLTIGNTHDYHRTHAEILATDSGLWFNSHVIYDIILGRQPDIPLDIQDSLKIWQEQSLPILISGAHIGNGPWVRESTIVSTQYTATAYTLHMEPNPVTLYCNENRSLATQPGDVVLYRWQESGLPAIVKHGNTIRVGTMLESLADWQYLYQELIQSVTQ